MEGPGLGWGGGDIIQINVQEIKWGACGPYILSHDRNRSQDVVSKVTKLGII